MAVLGAVALSRCRIAVAGCCGAVALSRWQAVVALSRWEGCCGAVALWHCGRLLWRCRAVALEMGTGMPAWLLNTHDALALWRCGRLLWRCRAVVLWQAVVALSRWERCCGAVALFFVFVFMVDFSPLQVGGAFGFLGVFCAANLGEVTPLQVCECGLGLWCTGQVAARPHSTH